MARKPVGSGPLTRSAAEHSPSVGQMNASPYINANIRSPQAEQQNVVNALNFRPKNGGSLTSEEFHDTVQPSPPLDSDSRSIASGPRGKPSAYPEPSATPKPDTDFQTVADMSRTLSTITTTTTATEIPPVPSSQRPPCHKWYNCPNGNEHSTQTIIPNGGTYAQACQNQGFAQQFDLHQQYQYQQAYGYDPYQIYEYPQHDSQAVSTQGDLYPVLSSSTVDTEQGSRSREPSIGSGPSLPNSVLNSPYSTQDPYSNYYGANAYQAQASTADIATGSTQTPWQLAPSRPRPDSYRRSDEISAKSKIPPGALYSNVPTVPRGTKPPKNPPLEINMLNRHTNPDLSPRSSIVVNTPTSVISQPLHTRYESPNSHHGSERSVGRSSNALSSTPNLPQMPPHRVSESGDATQTEPQEDSSAEKDATLGIGVGSAYVQRLRADAGETHIGRPPMSLPLGLRRTAKSAPMSVKPEFLRRAIDIRYTHLPQRMLEKEVDDDDDNTQDDADTKQDPGTSEKPYVGDSLDSPRGSVATSRRSTSPIDSIIEQTGKIKLFVANPGND